MELTKKCQICGEPCGDTYQLCMICNSLKNNGQIKKCDACNKYYLVTRGCSCMSGPIEYNNNYRENMKTPLRFRCEDGHYVRSEKEQKIDNWLYHNSYLHAYEPLLALYTENDELVYKIPDFYIPSRKLYIEYWGMTDEEYEANKKEKKKLYDLNNINYISLTEEDIKYSEDVIKFKINYDQRKK